MSGGDLYTEFAARLNRAGHGERGAIVSELEALTGLSRPTLYRKLKTAGYTSGRKRRADAGSSKCGLSHDDLTKIAGVQRRSKRKNKRVIMPTGTAVEILTESGDLTTEASLGTIRRHLHRAGLSRQQIERAWTTDDHTTPTHHTQLQSRYPNHLHLFDITPCIQYFFEGKGLKQRDKNLQLYGTKMPEYRKIKKHLLRYVLVDHCTGAFFVRYVYASGEAAADVVRFLWTAWRGQAEVLERYPFRGCPQILYLDAGAANLSGYVRTLLDNLDVLLISHKPGNPRAKGGVEGLMPFWEGQFESRLALKPAPDLETLNDWATDYCVYLNGVKAHRRHGHTRSALWASRIRAEALRIPPEWEVTQALAHSKPVTRVIGRDRIIRYKSGEYLVLDPVNLGDRALVSHDPYNYPAIKAELLSADGSLSPLQTRHLTRDEYGFFEDHGAVVGEEHHRLEDSPTQSHLKLAAETDLTAAAEAAMGGWADKLGQTRFVVRPGEEIEADGDAGPVTVTRLQAMTLIVAALGCERLTPLQAQAIAKRLGPEPWPRQAVEALADEMAAEAADMDIKQTMGVG